MMIISIELQKKLIDFIKIINQKYKEAIPTEIDFADQNNILETVHSVELMNRALRKNNPDIMDILFKLETNIGKQEEIIRNVDFAAFYNAAKKCHLEAINKFLILGNNPAFQEKPIVTWKLKAILQAALETEKYGHKEVAARIACEIDNYTIIDQAFNNTAPIDDMKKYKYKIEELIKLGKVNKALTGQNCIFENIRNQDFKYFVREALPIRLVSKSFFNNFKAENGPSLHPDSVGCIINYMLYDKPIFNFNQISLLFKAMKSGYASAQLKLSKAEALNNINIGRKFKTNNNPVELENKFLNRLLDETRNQNQQEKYL